ncbi:hypothetical protein [Limosilactobacillus caecicola]|nr:hypothetical protein [Limosilactobacillus caecicola]
MDFLDPFKGFAQVLQAMHGLPTGVQYASLVTVVALASICVWAYVHSRK